METYKNLLSESLKKINEKYFSRHERDFSYELYHLLRSVISNNVELTAETPKGKFEVVQILLESIFFCKYFYNQNNFSLESNSYKKSPDLLIHEYDTRKKQLIAIEIKPLDKSVSLILTDVTKLMFYTKCELKYKSGILILFSKDLNHRKITQIQNNINNSLIHFPEIEIWVANFHQIKIIWTNGTAQNPPIEIV